MSIGITDFILDKPRTDWLIKNFWKEGQSYSYTVRSQENKDFVEGRIAVLNPELNITIEMAE